MQFLPQELASLCGIIIFGKDFKIKYGSIFSLYVESFRKDVQKKMVDYLKKVQTSNSVIIQDPYILNESILFLQILINSLIDFKNIKIKLIITFILKNGEGKASTIDKLKNIYDDICHLEIIYSNQFHDRNIYTNTAWISSDYGFKDKYERSLTKWCIFPIGTFYDLYFEKLNEIKRYISLHNEITQNNLIS